MDEGTDGLVAVHLPIELGSAIAVLFFVEFGVANVLVACGEHKGDAIVHDGIVVSFADFFFGEISAFIIEGFGFGIINAGEGDVAEFDSLVVDFGDFGSVIFDNAFDIVGSGESGLFFSGNGERGRQFDFVEVRTEDGDFIGVGRVVHRGDEFDVGGSDTGSVVDESIGFAGLVSVGEADIDGDIVLRHDEGTSGLHRVVDGSFEGVVDKSETFAGGAIFVDAFVEVLKVITLDEPGSEGSFEDFDFVVAFGGEIGINVGASLRADPILFLHVKFLDFGGRIRDIQGNLVGFATGDGFGISLDLRGGLGHVEADVFDAFHVEVAAIAFEFHASGANLGFVLGTIDVDVVEFVRAREGRDEVDFLIHLRSVDVSSGIGVGEGRNTEEVRHRVVDDETSKDGSADFETTVRISGVFAGRVFAVVRGSATARGEQRRRSEDEDQFFGLNHF